MMRSDYLIIYLVDTDASYLLGRYVCVYMIGR